MPGYRIVTQPHRDIEYRSLLEAAIQQRKVVRFDAAVAYATYGGVKCLLELLDGMPSRQWDNTEKRWLIGIDWMRSEPAALDFLASLNKSTVRIHDGRKVVDRAGCTPRLPFHPKTFLVQGDGYAGAVIGSGNLSKNGLSRGHEVGVAITVGGAVSEGPAGNQVAALSRWFEGLWRKSAKWNAIRGDYLGIYKSRRNFTALVPTDDDSADTDALQVYGSSRGFTPEQLRQLRAAENLWIAGGKLTTNRGSAHPGNQLMMRRFTRVYFGFEAKDLPRNSDVGSVSVRYRSQVRDVSPIRFSDNSMDVITLPLTGPGGPVTYDHRILHFERIDEGQYLLRVRPLSELSKFQARSDQLGANFAMSSGRKFGVY